MSLIKYNGLFFCCLIFLVKSAQAALPDDEKTTIIEMPPGISQDLPGVQQEFNNMNAKASLKAMQHQEYNSTVEAAKREEKLEAMTQTQKSPGDIKYSDYIMIMGPHQKDTPVVVPKADAASSNQAQAIYASHCPFSVNLKIESSVYSTHANKSHIVMGKKTYWIGDAIKPGVILHGIEPKRILLKQNETICSIKLM